MCANLTNFDSVYGRKPPEALIRLFDESIVRSAPLRFEFADRELIIEIQYFLSVKDAKPCDIASDRFCFAITSDGFELLVDLVDESFPVLQRENDDLDSLRLSLDKLVDLTTSRFRL